MKPGDVSHSERREWTDPVTGRRMVQLTTGSGHDYPLYYYIPSFTADGQTLLFHRLQEGEIQYHRLDLATGRTVCLTGARTPNALWRPWLQPPAIGVREFLGAFNQLTHELIYFDTDQLRAVHIDTLADRLVTCVPPGRAPCGLTGISPDGKHFVYPHADRAWWDAHLAAGPDRTSAQAVALEVVNLATGETHTALLINTWVTHTHFYDNQRILFSHPPTEHGILITDLHGHGYACLRPQTAHNTQTCHYHATERGVMYELNRYAPPIDRGWGQMGIVDPDTRHSREYQLNARITHMGHDPAGWLWFGEQLLDAPNAPRVIGYCSRLEPDVINDFIPLTEPLLTCGDQRLQRAHTHPTLMPDRQHILLTVGDPRTQTNHPCLLDVSDLTHVRSEVQPVQ